MKKIIAMLIAVIMLMSVTAYANEINWADLQEQGAEMIAKGEFITLDEIAVQMWVPTAFIACELSDEDYEAGYIAYFMTEDEANAVFVMYVDVDGMTLEEYEAYLEEIGASDIQEGTVNGLPAVTYTLAENDVSCIAFTTERGYILEIGGSPVSDEGFASVLMFIMASIQAAE